MGAEVANNYNNNNIRVEEYQQMEECDVDISDSELVSHVRRALKSVVAGDNDDYSQLVGLLHYNERLKPDEVAMLVTSLKGISGAVSYIDHVQHESLLASIFSMSMWNYGPDVMDALIELITSLAASSGKYVDSCLDMLVSNFTPPFRFIESLKLPYGKVRKEQVMDRVHFALEYITGLVPLAPARLSPIVIERMQRIPRFFQRSPESVVVMFVENIFKLESSVIGELVGNSQLIMAVVDLLIDFDVEIGWDDILEENPQRGIFDMELEDELMLDDLDDDGAEFPRESWGKKRIWKDEVVGTLDKLDSVMVLTFEHLKFCKNSGRLAEVFEFLLQSFRATVLNAYKSKFTQFVIFYACSLDPVNCGTRFAESLAEIFTCSSLTPETRMSAVAYLASYLSRAKFLSAPFIVGMLQRLVLWCSDYCRLQSGDINPKAHRVFYAGCQAIMYVLCFCMRSIMEIPRLKSNLCLLPLRQILKNPLEPLKVCLPSIVEEFVRQAKSAHLLDSSGSPVFHDVLESEFSIAFGGKDRLDMFFPFDPCLLRKSDSFIRPNFVYWSMVKKAYEDDADGSTDDEIDVFYPDMNRAESRDIDIKEGFEEDDYLDDFNDSLNKMSITPKDSVLKKFASERRSLMQMPSKLRPSMSPESL